MQEHNPEAQGVIVAVEYTVTPEVSEARVLADALSVKTTGFGELTAEGERAIEAAFGTAYPSPEVAAAKLEELQAIVGRPFSGRG